MPLKTDAAARKDRTTAAGGPTLEHRHFAFIAATLADRKPPHSETMEERAAWDVEVDHWADACARTNPRFDRARFLSACGVHVQNSICGWIRNVRLAR